MQTLLLSIAAAQHLRVLGLAAADGLSVEEWGSSTAALRALGPLQPCGVSIEVWSDLGLFKYYTDSNYDYTFGYNAESRNMETQRAVAVVLLTDNDVEHLNGTWWSESEAIATVFLRNMVERTLVRVAGFESVERCLSRDWTCHGIGSTPARGQDPINFGAFQELGKGNAASHEEAAYSSFILEYLTNVVQWNTGAKLQTKA